MKINLKPFPDWPAVIAALDTIPTDRMPASLDLTTWHVSPSYLYTQQSAYLDALRAVSRITRNVTIDVGYIAATGETVLQSPDILEHVNAALAILPEGGWVTVSAQPFAYGPRPGNPHWTEPDLYELVVLRVRMAGIARACDTARRPVRRVNFDLEQYDTRVGDSNQIRAKHDVLYTLAKSIWPQATVDWWEFGHLLVSPIDGSHAGRTFAAPDILHDAITTTIQNVSEEFAYLHAYNIVSSTRPMTDRHLWWMPGGGYRRHGTNSSTFSRNWAYHPCHAWLFGRRCREWSQGQLRMVGTSGAPQDDPTHPWWVHFVAFVRGLLGINDLAGLEQE